jgi:hypothetical protein
MPSLIPHVVTSTSSISREAKTTNPPELTLSTFVVLAILFVVFFGPIVALWRMMSKE